MGVSHKDKPRLRPKNPREIGGSSRCFPPRFHNHEWSERWPALTYKELQTRQPIFGQRRLDHLKFDRRPLCRKESLLKVGKDFRAKFVQNLPMLHQVMFCFSTPGRDTEK